MKKKENHLKLKITIKTERFSLYCNFENKAALRYIYFQKQLNIHLNLLKIIALHKKYVSYETASLWSLKPKDNFKKITHKTSIKEYYFTKLFFLDRLLVAPYWGFISSTDDSQGATPRVYNCRPVRD